MSDNEYHMSDFEMFVAKRNEPMPVMCV